MRDERLALLQKQVAEKGLRPVADALKYSHTAIYRVMHGQYPAPDKILNRVVEVYGGLTVECPVMGATALWRCANEREKDFAYSNPVRARLYRTCPTCERYLDVLGSVHPGLKKGRRPRTADGKEIEG